MEKDAAILEKEPLPFEIGPWTNSPPIPGFKADAYSGTIGTEDNK
eukprot:CAMPEP_0170176548 /NCGR_PEP_ID=MMETSP0040_2-20121228/9402_1 /TAXON_ID=641309 /ORGANISM="Lotharella oceanica, Strain CCMP622" /LENGTH=44 /DNA_ID= /DNA_START= /DNA_END= /DNA_ORIENTATION=